MSAIWTIAEQQGGRLKGVSFELLARGRKLADKVGSPLVSLILGDGLGDEELQELVARGADEVYSVQDPRLAHFVCESYAAIVADLIERYSPSVVLAAATSSGRTLMPYLAVRLGAGLTADCTELDMEEGSDKLLQTRPAIGGNIMATIVTPDRRPQMATVRPKSAIPLSPDKTRRGTIIPMPVPETAFDGRVQVLGCRTEEGENLEEADLVVAGGKGLKKAENFALIRKLVEDLGKATGRTVGLGASREAVDRGWIGYPHQIGLSGKTVSPKLYIGAGISGSIQHLAGIKTSETIVSINPDPEAHLHKIADFAIVGDAFQVIPELCRRLEQRKGGNR